MTRPQDKTVLIVDDEPDVVAYFSGILERAGFNVVTATNGREALEAVRERLPRLTRVVALDPETARSRGVVPLEALLERPGIPLSRERLEQILYGWGEGVESNAVEVHIHHLRKKLGNDLIKTVRGVGYKLGE